MGDILLYAKYEASPFVYLQTDVLTAFCTLKSYTSMLIRQIESDIVRGVYFTFFDGKTVIGLLKIAYLFSHSTYIVSKYIFGVVMLNFGFKENHN